MKSFLYNYLPGILLFIVFLTISLFTYKDYGLTWDEFSQRRIGLVNYNYVFNDNDSLKTFVDKDYGAGFELPLVCVEKTFRITDSRDIYLVRHFLTHLFFLIAVFVGYVLFLRLYNSQLVATIGFLILVLTPRIYAHSFYNTKDLPFLSMFIITLFVAKLAFEKDKRLWYLLLGIACGYLTGIRIVGMILVASIGLFFLFDAIYARSQKRPIKPIIKNTLLFGFGFFALLCLSWPYVWSNPLHNFAKAYENSTHFRWTGSVIFMGSKVPGTKLPFSYLPVWFSITTPILWLILGIAGCVYLFISFVKKPSVYINNTRERNFLLYAICLVAPVVSVIILHAVIYDDWRHLYFIYVPFVLVVLFLLDKLLRSKLKAPVLLLCVAQFVIAAAFMIKYHPFQQVYFNEFVPKNNEYLRKNYDFEYWGVSYKQGLEYIVAHDTSAVIKVKGEVALIDNNKMILPPEQRKRIITVDQYVSDSADYFITNFRLHPEDYSFPKTYYEIRVLNSTMLRVYKLH